MVEIGNLVYDGDGDDYLYGGGGGGSGGGGGDRNLWIDCVEFHGVV